MRLERVAPARRGWALVGVLLGYSWFLVAGMINFAIGVGLSLVWLAAWWPRRARTSWVARVGLALGATALFAVHLAAALTVLVVVWVDVALAAVPRLVDGTRRWSAMRLPQLVTALVLTAAVGAVWAWAATAAGGQGDVPGPVFRSLESKIAAFGAPFYSVSLAQAGVMAAGYAASLLAFVYVNRTELRRGDTFLASSAAFLGIFLIFPKDMAGTGGTDVRWLMPLYVLPFCAASAGMARPQRAALGLAFAACLTNAGAMWLLTRDFDRRLDDFDAALRHVPATARLMPLISDQRSYPRVGPYQQYAQWHTIRGGGPVPGRWTSRGAREGEPPSPHLRHFVVKESRYLPPLQWGTTDASPLDWDRINKEHDYIVQFSDDPSIPAYVAAHAREVARAGDVRVYKVAGPRPAQGEAAGTGALARE